MSLYKSCNLLTKNNFNNTSLKMLGVLRGAKIFKVFYRKISSANNIPVSPISEIFAAKPVGSVQTVKGWIMSVRKMGKFIFLDVNDGSCLNCLQIVSPKSIMRDSFQSGASVNISGKLQETPKGQLELFAEEVDVVGKCDVSDDNFPFTPKQKQSYDFYRQYLHWRPKIEYFRCMLRFRSAAYFKIHEYFNENGFTHVHTPIITSNDCEGGGETFVVKPHSAELIKSMRKKKEADENVFFNLPAYLTVSGQLHLESVIRGLTKVYTFNPSFRAENSKSRLHLSEFYMVEAEEAFITDIESLLSRIEGLVKKSISYLLSQHLDDIKFMLQHNETDIEDHISMLERITDKPFSVMTFDEAKRLLDENKEKFEKSDTKPYNLTKVEELFLVKHNNNTPVFIIEWPKFEKPFYMKKSYKNDNLVQGVDLLVANVGELCGGSLREDNYDELREKLLGINMIESLEWYLDLRKFGSVPSGGFGLGFERLLQFVLNIQNIKDTIPFPRWPHGLQL